MEEMTLDDAVQLIKPYARMRIFTAARDPEFPFHALEVIGHALGLTDVTMEIVFRRNFGFDKSVRLATLIRTVKPFPSKERRHWSTYALKKRVFNICERARCFSRKDWAMRNPTTGRAARLTVLFDASTWEAIPKVREAAQSLDFVFSSVDIGEEKALHFYPSTIEDEVLLADFPSPETPQNEAASETAPPEGV